MARTVRGGLLETRASRLRLEPRGKPYYVASAKQGLHLGYRRLAGKNGPWIARRYQGRGGKYDIKAFASADDYSESDGAEVVGYYEAMRRVSGEAPPVRHGSQYSVPDAVRAYVARQARQSKSGADAKNKLEAYVLPYFAHRTLASLKPEDFDAWIGWALDYKPAGRRGNRPPKAPPKKKAKGNATPQKPVIDAAERRRRKKSTLNRIINAFHAALEQAFADGHVASRDAWARMKKFRGADSARLARLTADEARRLVNASAPPFRQLIESALLTGCRYGELIALRARDFDHGSATLLIAQSKSSRSRRVPLGDEGRDFFESITADKTPDDLILTKSDGSAWQKSDQHRRIGAACKAAGIATPVNFHALRHTFASLLVESGTPLAFVASALGHADVRMTSRHYSHLAPSAVHDSIRAKLPNFGVRIDTKVSKLRP